MTRSPMVVVGAGALGLCTAWHLTDRGVTDVTVIERDRVAGASSGLSVGIIETQYLDPLAIEIRVESDAVLRRARALGRARRSRRNGYLRPRARDADMEAFARSVEVQRTARRAPTVASSTRTSCATAGPGHATRRPGRRPVRPERRVHRRPRCTATRSAAAVVAARRPGPAGDRARRLRSAPRRSEPASRRTAATSTATSWSTPRAAGPAGSATLLGAPVDDPAATPPGADRAPAASRSATSCRRSWTTCRRPAGSASTSATTAPGRLVAGLHTEEVIHDIVDPDAVQS